MAGSIGPGGLEPGLAGFHNASGVPAARGHQPTAKAIDPCCCTSRSTVPAAEESAFSVKLRWRADPST